MGEIQDEINEWAGFQQNLEGVLGLDESRYAIINLCRIYIKQLEAGEITIEKSEQIRLKMIDDFRRLFETACMPQK